jgi:RNA polymerase sigma factor for flagellar operon FliA
LRKAINHAQRLAKLLVRMERTKSPDRKAKAWLMGRAGEVQAVVSVAVRDWREGKCESSHACSRIVTYLDELHRGVGKQFNSVPTLECCHDDEAITFAPAPDGRGEGVNAATDEATSDASTLRSAWKDGPDTLERVKAGLELVDREARFIVQRMSGSALVRLEDLRAFGQEGLLDAARSFDATQGAFAQWASLRIRGAMIDGLRQLGRGPAGRLLEFRDDWGYGDDGTHCDSVDLTGVPNRGLGKAMPGAGFDTGRLIAQNPEERLARAKANSALHEAVAQLPKAERAVVERYYFEEESIEQVAEALGIGKATASRKLASALGRMERALRRKEGTPPR